jgi:hypothetical protein
MWQEWLNRLFPVRIETQSGVLRISDRRPSDIFLTSIAIAAASLLISGLILRPSISFGIYWPLIVLFLPAPIFAVKSLSSPLNSTHVFDKNAGVYSSTLRTALSRKTIEADLGQIRGVQVERRIRTTSQEVGVTETYRTVLLLKQGLLFGSSDIVPLREDSPVGSYYETETQISGAISGYLAVDVPQLVDL